MSEHQTNTSGDCGLIASRGAHGDIDSHVSLHVGRKPPVASGCRCRVGRARQDKRRALFNSRKRRIVIAVLDGARDGLTRRRGRCRDRDLHLEVLGKRVGKSLLEIERRRVGVCVLGRERAAHVQQDVAKSFGHMFGGLSESGVGDVGVRDKLGFDDRDAHVLGGPRRHVFVGSSRLAVRARVDNDGP